jgi:cytochrome P450
VVAKRITPEAEDQKDMLGAFLRHGVTPRQCEVEVPFQLIAGSDTTATAVRGTMLHLGVSRHAYLTLQKEIDTAAAEGRISSPITNDEAKKLEYLQVSRNPILFLLPNSRSPDPAADRSSLTPPTQQKQAVIYEGLRMRTLILCYPFPFLSRLFREGGSRTPAQNSTCLPLTPRTPNK